MRLSQGLQNGLDEVDERTVITAGGCIRLGRNRCSLRRIGSIGDEKYTNLVRATNLSKEDPP